VCRYKNVFNVETKERVYFLVAKSQSDMESWVDALCKVCGLHTDNTPLTHYAAPPCVSSKTKGPNITQPIYAATTRDTPYATGGHTTNPPDSVYSLAAKSEYMQHNLLHNTVSEPTDFPPSSYDVVTRKKESIQTSVSSVGEDVAQNRLSEMAFFSPRPGDGLSFLAPGDPLSKTTTTTYGVTPGHRAVSKSKSTTLAPNLPRDTPNRLDYRSQTNAVGRYQDPQGRIKFSNGGMSSSTLGRGMPGTALSTGLTHIPESSFDPLPATLDRDSAARDEGYGVLHVPPPIDRSKKPPQPLPPAIDRGLKPGDQRVNPDSSDSEGSQGPDELPPYTKLTEEDGSAVGGGGAGEEVGKEEHETQFNVAEIPRVTVRTTHYTQVHFDPSLRRPVPLPRKTASLPSMAPKPSQRINYTDVDIVATTQLSDHLHRQLTVRGAERQALAEKHYVNVDHSGLVDDETDPDYYTHMRDFCFDEADRPYIFTPKSVSFIGSDRMVALPHFHNSISETFWEVSISIFSTRFMRV
jgi:hypothetical protein